MDKNFVSEASKLAFKLFWDTGEIRFYSLYKAIENPELDKQIFEENEREM